MNPFWLIPLVSVITLGIALADRARKKRKKKLEEDAKKAKEETA